MIEDELIKAAKADPSGCHALSTEFDGKYPHAVVLVATGDNERTRLLWALHELWFPDEEDYEYEEAA